MTANTTDGIASFDIAIIGGGLAGLSLAVRLADAQFQHLKILLVEPRAAYTRDRTWCYWRTATHPFEAAVSHQWSQWDVRAEAGDTRAASNHYPYQMIAADALYQSAQKALRDAAHIQCLMGHPVTALNVVGEKVEFIVNEQTLAADLVFDSRPTSTVFDAGLVQRFEGWEIEADHACFTPAVATLMDFVVPSEGIGCIHFMYVLPTSPTRALVEDTWFSSQAEIAAFQPDYASNIDRYLRDQFGLQSYQIQYREQASLPMNGQLRPATTASRHIKIGVAGGMGRASSGFAFHETQRACDAIVAKLATLSVIGPFQLPTWRSVLSYWMDSVFLRVLEDEPQHAADLFLRLFANVKSDSLVRFMSGIAIPIDTLRVIAACPKRPFLMQALGLNRRKQT